MLTDVEVISEATDPQARCYLALFPSSNVWLQMSPGFFHTYRLARPLRNRSVLFHPVRDEAVLVSEKGGELLALNATARAVWEQCDGSATVEDVCAHLAQDYNAEPGVIQSGVCSILADFRAKGLIGFQPSDSSTKASGPGKYFVSFLDHHVEIHIAAPKLATAFEFCMDATFSSGEGTTAGRIEAYAHKNGYRVRAEKGTEEIFERRSDALTWMKRHFVTCLMKARRDLLWFHAGAVSKNGHAILCAGHRGCGKSTLVTALYEDGWHYFTDDVLPYEPATGCVIPFPLTPVYRETGQDLVTEEELHLVRKTQIRLEPERIAAGRSPVSLLVFPTFQPHSPRPPAERGPASAVVKLTKHCFNLRDYQSDPMPALLELAERVPAYDVEHNEDYPALRQLRPHIPQ